MPTPWTLHPLRTLWLGLMPLALMMMVHLFGEVDGALLLDDIVIFHLGHCISEDDIMLEDDWMHA
jgi:hypothetical protein